MQIEKINENQLGIILDLEDLKKNNISLHSFMCHSTQSQGLCFDILNLVNKEINFSIQNYELIIEAFAVPSKCSFILLITRVPKKAYLHVSKTKYGVFKVYKSFWLKFDTFENFCMFCSFINTNLSSNSFLYLLNNHYFLHIKLSKIKHFLKIKTLALEFANHAYDNNYVLDENAEFILKNNAIEICKKYCI